jgi:hypothetical protein
MSALKSEDGFPAEKVSLLSSSGFYHVRNRKKVCKETLVLFVNKVNSVHFCIFVYLPMSKIKINVYFNSCTSRILKKCDFFQNVCSLVVYFVCLVLRLIQIQQQSVVKTFIVLHKTEFKFQHSLRVVAACFIPSISSACIMYVLF